jgi:hypothetical protein
MKRVLHSSKKKAHLSLAYRLLFLFVLGSVPVVVGCTIFPGGDPCTHRGGDYDHDGICDDEDLCISGSDHQDQDNDGVEDACDPCPSGPNVDSDGDGVCDALDQCPGLDNRIDVDGDGTPDCVDPCLPPDCPAPGEVDNGDFENDLTGWTYTSDVMVNPPEVVRDATGTGWELKLAPVNTGCNFRSEAIGVMRVPEIEPGALWSLRFRYRMYYDERYVVPGFEPSFQLLLDSSSVHREFITVDVTSGWVSVAFCLSENFSGLRTALSLQAALPDSHGCNLHRLDVRVDDIELTPDVPDCLIGFP